MSDKYIRALRRMAQDRNLTPEAAEKMLRAHANDGWEESKHPRGKGGKFVSKGSGSSGGGSESSSESKSSGGSKAPSKIPSSTAKPSSSGKKNQPGQPSGSGQQENKTAELIPKPESSSKYYARKQEKPGISGMIRAKRITNAGAESMKHRVAKMDSAGRFAPKPGEMREGPKLPEGSAFNNPKAGKPTAALPKGTGATRLSVGDLYDERKPNAKHTINQYLDDNGNLTPEREALHRQAVDNLFAGKKPKGPGEKKTFTMFGGGSAAGKGGLSDPKRCQGFKSSFFQNGTPSKETTATIDSDELKKDIPEYREMQDTDTDNAAAVAHEESSALAKRAMEAAFDNGYDCTLDGTGDGSVNGVLKKIKQARDRGYEVNACYVTCPTEQAVKQAKDRAQRTGRNVKEKTVRSIHRDVSRIFPQVASEFDHCALFDTSDHSKPPVLVAECERGGKIRIVNQALYDAFLKKGEENI